METEHHSFELKKVCKQRKVEVKADKRMKWNKSKKGEIDKIKRQHNHELKKLSEEHEEEALVTV